MLVFWQCEEASCWLHVPSRPMFSYYQSVFRSGGQLSFYLLCKITSNNFLIIFSVCFSSTAMFVVSNLYSPSMLRGLKNEGCLCANDKVKILLRWDMIENIFNRGLLRIISSYAGDLMLVFWLLQARARLAEQSPSTVAGFLISSVTTVILIV